MLSHKRTMLAGMIAALGVSSAASNPTDSLFANPKTLWRRATGAARYYHRMITSSPLEIHEWNKAVTAKKQAKIKQRNALPSWKHYFKHIARDVPVAAA